MPHEDIRFHHIRQNGHPRATIAYRILRPTGSAPILEVGLALCNPRDQFNKEEGRVRAEARLVDPGTCLSGQLIGNEPSAKRTLELARFLVFQVPAARRNLWQAQYRDVIRRGSVQP